MNILFQKNKVFTYILGLCMFLLPWDRYFITDGSVSISLSYVFIVFLLATFVIFVLTKRFYYITIPKYMVPILILLLYATISLLWNDNRSEGLNELSYLWFYFLSAILISSVTYFIKVDIKKVLWFYVLGTLSIGVYAIILNGFESYRFVIIKGYNPTWYAAYIVWAIVSTSTLFRGSSYFIKCIILIIDIVLFIFLLLTQGKNSILALIVSMFIVLVIYVISIKQESKGNVFSIRIMNPLKFIKAFAIIFVMVGAIIALMFASGLNQKLDRIANLSEFLEGNSSKATSGRTVIWRNYLNGVNERSIFGNGTDSSHSVYENVYEINTPIQSPHNTYILTLVEYGVVGLMLWLLFLLILIKYSSKSDNSRYILICLSLIFIFLALGNDILTYKYWWNGLFIFILITRINENTVDPTS